jgi:hypothetical protein
MRGTSSYSLKFFFYFSTTGVCQNYPLTCVCTQSIDNVRRKEPHYTGWSWFVVRLVITKRNRDAVLLDASGRVSRGIPDDSYRERLIKYIPAETLALFVAAYGITYYLSGSQVWYPLMARWILVAGILGTLLYLWQAEGVSDIVQLAISTIGFILWASALGVVTIASLPFYSAMAAGVLLVVWVFGAPLIDGLPETW